MAGLTPGHLLLILLIALVVIGPGKLPEVGSALGKSIREFQKAVGQRPDGSDAAAVPQPVAPVYPVGSQPPAQSFYAAPPAYGAQPPAYAAQPPAYAPYPAQPSGVAPAGGEATPSPEHQQVD